MEENPSWLKKPVKHIHRCMISMEILLSVHVGIDISEHKI